MGAGGARKGAGRPPKSINAGAIRVKTREEYEKERVQQNLKRGMTILSEVANHLRSLLAR